MSRYRLFDRRRIQLQDLEERGCALSVEDVAPLAPPAAPYDHPEFSELTEAVVAARRADRPVVLFIGGHPIKLGLSRFLVDLIERRVVTHVATNGAGIIHDFELALGAGTDEDVPRWIKAGQFGLWKETGQLNDVIAEGFRLGEGLGEAVGRAIETRQLPHRRLSIAAAGWRAGVPVTSHVGVGCDIIHAHANCSGAALGATSYTDFLIFAQSILDFAHEPLSEDAPPAPSGVFLNVGSAVAGPEVYLKALSMARNVARQSGREIRRFTTAVFDLVELPEDYREGTPSKAHPQYYYRPWKTILVRTVADGGTSYYFQGDHRRTLPTLWRDVAHRVPRRAAA